MDIRYWILGDVWWGGGVRVSVTTSIIPELVCVTVYVCGMRADVYRFLQIACMHMTLYMYISCSTICTVCMQTCHTLPYHASKPSGYTQ